MFARLLNRLSRKRDPERDRSLGDALMRLLEEHNLLTVDRKLLHMLKTSRKEFFRVVYHLVMRESMYMMADIEGKVILMTNAEFTRFMMRRSVTRETEIRRRDRAPAATVSAIAKEETINTAAPAGFVASVAGPKAVGDILCSDTESALFTGATLGGAPMDGVIAIAPEVSDSDDNAAINTIFPAHLMQGEAEPSRAAEYEWLNLGADASGKKGENLPEGRQSLPGRRREARQMAEAVAGKAE